MRTSGVKVFAGQSEASVLSVLSIQGNSKAAAAHGEMKLSILKKRRGRGR